MPELAGGATSSVRVVHSSELTTEMVDDIVTHRRKVAVLGAGKSAHEILWLLREPRAPDLTWLYTKSLWALSYEVLYRDSRDSVRT